MNGGKKINANDIVSSTSNPIGNNTYTRSSSAPSDIRQNGTNSSICPKSYAMGYKAGKEKAMEIVASALRQVNDEYQQHQQNMCCIINRLTNQLNNL